MLPPKRAGTTTCTASWFTAREQALRNLPEGIDPAIAVDVDYFVGAKAIEVSTRDLVDHFGVEYNTSHATFLAAPWDSVFGYLTE